MFFSLLFLSFGSSAEPSTTSNLETGPSLGSWGEDYFGGALGEIGDVNGDGFDDLLVGAQLHSWNQVRAGAVYVLYGSALGLIYTNQSRLTPTESTEGHQFGDRVLSQPADFNGDGKNDVAASAIYYGEDDARFGSVYAWYGSDLGIDPRTEEMIQPSDLEEKSFCCNMGAGKLNGDRYSDLVLGDDYATVDGKSNAGKVTVVFGHEDGLGQGERVEFSQAEPIRGGYFGRRVLVGDFGGRSAISVSASGTKTVSLWAYDGADFKQVGLVEPEDTDKHSGFGKSLAQGHVMPDDAKALLVGAPDEGRVYVYPLAQASASEIDFGSPVVIDAPESAADGFGLDIQVHRWSEGEPEYIFISTKAGSTVYVYTIRGDGACLRSAIEPTTATRGPSLATGSFA